MKALPVLAALAFSTIATLADDSQWVTYQGKSGPGAGKHIVFLTGDEEYRSEEGMPQLARILAERHGFKCTVLFSINPTTGAIDPQTKNNEPGIENLDTADLCIMLLRFRAWPDEQMKHFVDYYTAGKPFIGLRTSTHAFDYPADSKSAYAKFGWGSKSWPGGFGKQVLGETWVAHHGAHKKEGTRGIIDENAKSDPILRGVSDIFGDTDVYTAAPPADAKILVRGQVTASLDPQSPPTTDTKKNDPMQPVVWTRESRNELGTSNKVLCTTMGSSTDLKNEGLRRLLVNAAYSLIGLNVPEKADVTLVGDYKPLMYGFNGEKKGVKPSELSK